jgi:hypothetical protein
MAEKSAGNIESKTQVPVRGSLRLTVNTSSPQVTAGSDFSIFVVIQNPFDIPITIHQVQTHIPIELIDINGLRIDLARREKELESFTFIRYIYELAKYQLTASRRHSGIAIAVGTDFDPTIEREIIKMSTNVETLQLTSGSTANLGMNLIFPENPTSEELDAIFRRIFDYQKGLIPVQLQPGDSIVRQFVLRTGQWLFFTPLTHRFQIQVNYSGDSADHTETIAYEQNIRSTMSAMAIGAACGAILGTMLKSLSASPAASNGNTAILRSLIASILAAVAVVIAFARKSNAQPIISIEDFWGGALIGFSVGYLGFDQFRGLFGGTPT